MGPQSAWWRSITTTSSKPQSGVQRSDNPLRTEALCEARDLCNLTQQRFILSDRLGLDRPSVASHDMTTNMRHFSIPALSQPLPVYVSARLTKGIVTRQRKRNTKQQATRTRSEHARQSQSPAEVDPIMHREDLNFIAFMFTIEQLKCETLVN